MNKRKVKRILESHVDTLTALHHRMNWLQVRFEKYADRVDEQLKALTLRVDALHVEQAWEGLEEEIERVAEDNPGDFPLRCHQCGWKPEKANVAFYCVKCGTKLSTPISGNTLVRRYNDKLDEKEATE